MRLIHDLPPPKPHSSAWTLAVLALLLAVLGYLLSFPASDLMVRLGL